MTENCRFAKQQFKVYNKKVQLSLTNPRDAKPCRKLLQFDVETSYRQLNKQFV